MHYHIFAMVILMSLKYQRVHIIEVNEGWFGCHGAGVAGPSLCQSYHLESCLVLSSLRARYNCVTSRLYRRHQFGICYMPSYTIAVGYYLYPQALLHLNNSCRVWLLRPK